MRTTYQITAKQLIILALLTAVFAAGAVVLYQRFGDALVDRGAVAKNDKGYTEAAGIAGLTDPSVATDEKNNKEVYDGMSPGVVNITSTVNVQDFFYAYPQKGTGSGSILDKEGHILTNFHVIQDAQKLEVSLSNDHTYLAKVLGADPDNDLAVIKIDAPKETLTPIPLGSSKDLFVGQKVLAIGNPFGLDRTLTTGIVSGLSRPLRSEFTNRLIEGAIQTDAAINPGNSGGPLLNSRGQMIGINTMIYSPSGGSVGIGFAVPVETAKRVISDIKQYGRVRKPRLGIEPIALSALGGRLANELGLPVKDGLMVVRVVPGGAADRAGIKGATEGVQVGGSLIPVDGDIIINVDGQAISSKDDLDRVLNSKTIGDSVKIEVMRGKRKLAMTVQLAELPNSTRQRI